MTRRGGADGFTTAADPIIVDHPHALVLELVDRQGSELCVRKVVRVRFSPRANWLN